MPLLVGTTIGPPGFDTAVSAAGMVAVVLAVAGKPVYEAADTSGLGSITIGAPGANAVGWWIAVPADTVPGTYLSTVTLDIVSGP